MLNRASEESVLRSAHLQGVTEGKVEGLKEGKAVGLKEGKAEGQAETLRQVLPMMAAMRFGTVPDDLIDRLRKYNLAMLQQLQATIQNSLSVDMWLASMSHSH